MANKTNSKAFLVIACCLNWSTVVFALVRQMSRQDCVCCDAALYDAFHGFKWARENGNHCQIQQIQTNIIFPCLQHNSNCSCSTNYFVLAECLFSKAFVTSDFYSFRPLFLHLKTLSIWPLCPKHNQTSGVYDVCCTHNTCSPLNFTYCLMGVKPEIATTVRCRCDKRKQMIWWRCRWWLHCFASLCAYVALLLELLLCHA